MINRTLIRLKTVQMLYSYLLTYRNFSVQTAPQRQTKDSRFSYALYLDLLALILKLSGYKGPNILALPFSADNRLSQFSIISLIGRDDILKAAIARGEAVAGGFDGILVYINNAIISSVAYKDFAKIKKPTIEDEATFWSVILKTIFAKDEKILNTALTFEGFTQVGYQRAVDMASETLSSCSDNVSSFITAVDKLHKSLEKSYELYHAILLLMVAITEEQKDAINQAKDKYLKTASDLNPQTRFVDNRFIESIRYNGQMEKYLKDHPISWNNELYIVRQLRDSVIQSELYAEYMAKEEVTYADDCELWRQILKTIIVPSDALAEALEAKSIYWNDDLDIMATFVAKTIKQFAAAGSDNPGLLPMYKDEEDAKFGEQLFVDTVKNFDNYKEYIIRFVDKEQWDAERIPFMDNIIISVIMSELINFPLIPIPVTINEYVDIANRYSSAKSGIFINGIISNIIKTLREEGKIQK